MEILEEVFLRMYLDDAILNQRNQVKELHSKKILIEVKQDLIALHHDYFVAILALQLEEQSFINALTVVIALYVDLVKNLREHNYYHDATQVIDKLLSILTLYESKLTKELYEVKSALEDDQGGHYRVSCTVRNFNFF